MESFIEVSFSNYGIDEAFWREIQKVLEFFSNSTIITFPVEGFHKSRGHWNSWIISKELQNNFNWNSGRKSSRPRILNKSSINDLVVLGPQIWNVYVMCLLPGIISYLLCVSVQKFSLRHLQNSQWCFNSCF